MGNCVIFSKSNDVARDVSEGGCMTMASAKPDIGSLSLSGTVMRKSEVLRCESFGGALYGVEDSVA